MQRKNVRQVAFNLGEIDPLLLPRDDNSGLAAACAYLKNYMPLMQGSLERRDGLEHCDFVRNQLLEVTVNDANFAAPNGGIAANLFNNNNFITDTQLSNSTDYIVCEWEYAAPKKIELIDLIDFALVKTVNGTITTPVENPTGGWSYQGYMNNYNPYYQYSNANENGDNYNAFDFGVNAADNEISELYGAIKIQYFSQNAWFDFGPALSIGVALRSRRFGIKPNIGAISAKWRIVINTLNGGARHITLKTIKAYAETNVISNVKAKTFTINSETGAYLMVITQGNIEFYSGKNRVGSAFCAIQNSGIGEIDVTQTLDTILLFHKTMPPLAIMRQGTSFDWDFRDKEFSNIPKYDFDGTRAGGINEVQQLRFTNYENGDIFNLTIEDNTTGQIVYQGSGAATAAAVQSALESLANIGVGNIACSGGTEANTINITFQNDCGNEDWPEIVGKTIKTNMGGEVTATLTQGEVGGEPKFSNNRGYASCGTFYAQRLWQGGFGSLPEDIVASKTGDYFNLRTKGARDDAAIDVSLDSDQVSAIKRIYPGRSLMIFTSSSEFYWSSEPPRPSAPGIKNTTKHGILSTAAPIEIDGAVMFVPRNANDILQVVWDEQQQTYSTQSLITLSAHLIENITDIAYRRRFNSSKPDMLFVVKSDGKAVGISIMRTENVTGFFRFETEGQIICASGDEASGLYMVIKRGGKNRLERLGQFNTDAAIKFGIVNDKIITGLNHLEGFEVAVIIDGEDTGRQIVTNGQITLPFFAADYVEIGIPYICQLEAVPLAREGDRQGRNSHKIAVSGAEIEASIYTRRFEIKGSGTRWWALPLRSIDEYQLDQMAKNDFKSGFIGRIEGMMGSDQYGKLAVRCLEQTKHTINSLVIKGAM